MNCRYGYVFNDTQCKKRLCLDCITRQEGYTRQDVVDTREIESLDSYGFLLYANAINPYDYHK